MKKARVIPHTSWAAKSLWSVEGKTMSMLLFALAILGIGDGLIVLANLGSSPWTVLSQGVALQAKVSIGWSSFWISCLVMLAWIPLKLKLGLGTILNIIVIAFFLGLTTKIVSEPTALFSRIFIRWDWAFALWIRDGIVFNLSSRSRPAGWFNGGALSTPSFKSGDCENKP